MAVKSCVFCNELKLLSEFSKDKSAKDGLMRACKGCAKLRTDAYRKTQDGLIAVIYSSQRRCSKRRGHQLPDYSIKQLKKWVYSQSNFDELYHNWVKSGYSTAKVPSIDRKDDYSPYTIDNLLRICTWPENNNRGYADRRNGINNKHSKAVHRLAPSGELIDEYYSQQQASRDTGINQKDISACCLGNRKSAGGFGWKFANLVAV